MGYKRIDYTVLEMKTNIEGFRALREIVKKTWASSGNSR